MRKAIKFLFSFCLILIILSGVVACKDKEETESKEPNIVESEHYLVQNGNSDYIVVYPQETATSIIDTAISELTLFFEQATGIKLTVKSDEDLSVVWSKSAKFISLGDTLILKASGAQKEIDYKSLNISGYTIKNVGSSVFLVGGRENGVINAVYRFLREQFNFECYADDEIVLDTNVVNEKLLDYDNLVEIPAIAFHASAQNELMLNAIYARRLGMCPQDDWLVELGGTFYHNWLGTIPKSVYGASHSNWFAPNTDQLCLTRDKEGLAEEVKNKIIQVLLKNPSGYAIGFTQEDDGGWCECDSCKACSQKYGGNSASQILFMNYLWEILEPWLKENMPDREVYLYMFAYQSNTEPPKADANGNIPEEMKLNEHIYVQYAPIYAAGYQSYGYKNPNGQDNSVYDNMFKGWQKVTKNFMIWSYSFYYKGATGMYPYFDFADMKETFSYLVDTGANYLFDEDHSGLARRWSDWSRLKFYLRAHLAWNLESDLGELTDKFFSNYYKVASNTMRLLFDEYCTHYAMIIKENDLRGQGGQIDILDTKLWPKGILDRWMGLFDKAFKDIEPLKTENPEIYSKLEERIRLESISLRYLCESLYGDCDYVGNGNSVIEDCRYFGITIIS